jgi:DNA-binding NarL/FixJ family response regulator
VLRRSSAHVPGRLIARIVSSVGAMATSAHLSPSSPAPTVVVADDHVPTRLALRMALEAGGFVVVGEVGTGTDAVEAVLATRPHACLLDVHLPGGGIEAAEAISARAPGTTVVMLTAAAVAEELIAAVEAGASGYLLKTMDIRRLPSALHGALSGEPAVPRALVAWLLYEIRPRGRRRAVPFSLRGRVVELTPREAQVLNLMWKELPTREMAARLGISEVTVRRHASALLRKLGARDRETVVALLNRQRRPGGAAHDVSPVE